MKEFRFTVTGGIDVDDDCEPILAADGSICGFTLPDGTEVKLLVALEHNTGERVFPITSCRFMEELGFSNLEYDQADFEEIK